MWVKGVNLTAAPKGDDLIAAVKHRREFGNLTPRKPVESYLPLSFSRRRCAEGASTTYSDCLFIFRLHLGHSRSVIFDRYAVDQ